jgi:DNA polymerase-4
VHSAMPMFKALAACPKAVVIRPNMDKYAREGRRIRELMRSVTPLVEPLSIDEAFLDLAGTERLHGRPPAATLAKLALAIEREVGVTVSIGLSYNKFLAKISSDLDKPRGFGLVGRGEATRFLATLPVSRIWGVGKTLHAKMKADGYSTIGDLQGLEETDLVRRYGSIGQRLYRFGRGEDYRAVDPESVTKSVSTETTFDVDLATMDDLKPHLWRLAESLSRRLKEKSLSGRVVTLKLKSRDFRTTTRQSALPAPTVMADVLYRTGFALLSREIDGREFRLIGIGVSDLHDIAAADPIDLADPERQKRRKVEQALDSVREKLGRDAIGLGRGLNAMARGKSAPPETSPDETDRGRR